MKSIVAVEIHRSRREVAMLMADPGNMTQWMPTLERYEHIGGEIGAVGSKFRMVPKRRSRQIAFLVRVNDMYLPERYALLLRSRKVEILSTTTFTALAKDRTKLVSEETYIFPGVFRRLIGFFMRNRTRRRHRALMESFKRFVESVPSEKAEVTPPLSAPPPQTRW